MLELEIDGDEFQRIAEDILTSGARLRFRARGTSMQPFILDGDILEIESLPAAQFQRGTIGLFQHRKGRLLAHRIMATKIQNSKRSYLVKGDACLEADGWFEPHKVLGVVVSIQRGAARADLTTTTEQRKASLVAAASPLSEKIKWLPVKLRQYLKRLLFKLLLPNLG